jgi:hypothetical protein
MKRYLFAAGAGSLVFAAALGSASALGIDPGVAQSGHETLRGDSNGVAIESWGYESDDNSSYFIKVADVDPSLGGKTLWAQVYDGANTRLAKGSADISGTTVTVRWPAPIDVEKIESVRLTIE